MALLKEIQVLLRKEFVLEWRQKTALNGILLYVLGTVYICYMSFNLKRGQLNPATWNALFWVILLFAAVNAMAKSFLQESQGRYLYYYSVCSPESVILSKIVYNMALMATISGLALLFYSLVMGNPIQDLPMFLLNLVLGTFGFAATLTLVSGIAAKAGNNLALMSVLSFPLLIPMLLMLIKISKSAIDGLEQSLVYDEIGVLLAINAIVAVLSWVLFPYLWRS
jgi:heme exporter protein B